MSWKCKDAYWGPRWQENRGNGGSGKNGEKGGNGEEGRPNLSDVAQTLQEMAQQLGDIAKAISSGADQDHDHNQDQDPYLRQKVAYKLRELIHNVCAGAGNDLDLTCLLRCLNCLGAGSSSSE